MTSLAFLVVAPEVQIKAGIFTQKLNKVAIKKAVQARAESFSTELGDWFDKWFSPTIEKIHIEAVSWESLIRGTESIDLQAYQSISRFYHGCLAHNGSR
jgi:hypothetical protein